MTEERRVQIAVRFVGRKGRRARIALTAPAGASFAVIDISSMTT